jgi:hypothetical protein
MFSFIAKLWNAAKGWRTLIVSLALAIMGVLQTADWTSLVGTQQVGPVMIVISAVVALLRAFTDTPVGKSNSTSGS